MAKKDWTLVRESIFILNRPGVGICARLSDVLSRCRPGLGNPFLCLLRFGPMVEKADCDGESVFSGIFSVVAVAVMHCSLRW